MYCRSLYWYHPSLNYAFVASFHANENHDKSPLVDLKEMLSISKLPHIFKLLRIKRQANLVFIVDRMVVSSIVFRPAWRMLYKWRCFQKTKNAREKRASLRPVIVFLT